MYNRNDTEESVAEKTRRVTYTVNNIRIEEGKI